MDGLGASEGGCKAALGAVPVEKVPEEDCWAVPVVADADDRPAVSCDAMSVKCNASQWRVFLLCYCVCVTALSKNYTNRKNRLKLSAFVMIH